MRNLWKKAVKLPGNPPPNPYWPPAAGSSLPNPRFVFSAKDLNTPYSSSVPALRRGQEDLVSSNSEACPPTSNDPYRQYTT